MSRFCTRCGKPLAPNDRFCTSCGRPIALAVRPDGQAGPPLPVATKPKSTPALWLAGALVAVLFLACGFGWWVVSNNRGAGGQMAGQVSPSVLAPTALVVAAQQTVLPGLATAPPTFTPIPPTTAPPPTATPLPPTATPLPPTVVPSPTRSPPTPAPTTVIITNKIPVSTDGTVPEAFVEDTHRAVDITLEYFKSKFGVEINRDIRILLVPDKDSFKQALIRELKVTPEEADRRVRTTTAWTGGTLIIHNVDRLTDSSRSKATSAFVIAHELTHQLQYQECSASGRLMWLHEGMADYVAGHIVESAQLYTMPLYQLEWFRIIRQAPALPPLGKIHTSQEWYASLDEYGSSVTYRTATYAVGQLVRQPGVAGLFAYCKAVRNSEPAAAFRATFGMALSDYETSFDPQDPPSGPPAPVPVTVGGYLYASEFKYGPSGFRASESDNLKYEYRDGAWHIAVKKENWSGWLNISDEPYHDFVAEAVAYTAGGPEDNAYGLIFRNASNDNYMRCQISALGKYQCQVRKDGKTTPLQDWTPHPAIKTGKNQKNTLVVVAKGDSFSFWANGQKMANFTQSGIENGRIGLLAASRATPGIDVAFDSIRVWEAE